MNFKKTIERFPFIGGVLSQIISLFVIRNIFYIFKIQVEMYQFVFFQGILALLLSIFLFKLPKWFYAISFLFPFLFLIDSNILHISKNIYGILFVIFALTFSHTLKERVPLYLSNKTTFEALKKIVRDRKAQSFVDLGSGLGGVVRSLSSLNVKSFGVESAPILWLISSLISLGRGKILRKNIWDTDLSNYDVVYAFLSPAIMDKLYLKVKKEMRSNTMFVSNSFIVNGVEADEVWELDDQRATKLYLYQIK